MVTRSCYPGAGETEAGGYGTQSQKQLGNTLKPILGDTRLFSQKHQNERQRQIDIKTDRQTEGDFLLTIKGRTCSLHPSFLSLPSCITTVMLQNTDWITES